MAITPIINPAPDDPAADTLYVVGNKVNNNEAYLDDRINTEGRGKAWQSTITYQIGDIVTEDVRGYLAKTINTNKQPSANSADWQNATDERGGVLHNPTGVEYKVGDIVTVAGSDDIYVCLVDHTSSGTCVGDDTNWIQPYTPLSYSFPSTVITGHTGSSMPPGAHVVDPPDENGSEFFSVETSAKGKPAIVKIDGIQLLENEYDTASWEGYVRILNPVSENSWVQIVI